jgi:hypothetical protein
MSKKAKAAARAEYLLQAKVDIARDILISREAAKQQRHADIDEHVRLAEQGDCASFRWLLNLYQKQLCEEKRIDVQLAIFFDGVSRQIWKSADPVAKLCALIGGDRRGPKVKNADRDFHIAVLVESRRKSQVDQYSGRRYAGISLEAACEEIANLKDLDTDRVMAIYKAICKQYGRTGLKAQIALKLGC